MVDVLTPQGWAQRHFSDVDLGDKRRNRRATQYAAAAAASPSLSIPDQCRGHWKQTKAAYRFFSMAEVTFDKLQLPHRRQTLQAASGAAVVLWVSDTTTLSFDHPATDGLGSTGSGGRGQGMLLHTTLGIDVSAGPDEPPMVLGLGAQQCWTRGEQSSHPLAASSVESSKWPRGIQMIATPPPRTRWVHVGDCESDCWEAMQACQQQHSGFAIRACQNRKVIAGHHQPQSTDGPQPMQLLFDLLEQQPTLGDKRLWVRSRGEREARWAKLNVSATAVTLLSPRNWSDKAHRKATPKPAPQICWAVRVWEVDVPAGQEPIEWVILTDEPVGDSVSALTVIFWYSCRWLIEEYHKCLKTGCNIEKRQLETESRLEALLGIFAIVAVRLLQLKHYAKVKADAPAASIVLHRYVKTLAAYLKQPMKQMTARHFWRETARLGGFLGRKSDGDPGWITLWRGWQKLELLTDGMELAAESKRCG